jgi:hypothetical protein
MVSVVQALPSEQLVGHDDGGSQVSPGSIVPLPHAPLQSGSSAFVHPLGQHESPPVHVVTLIVVHWTLHADGVPVSMTTVHGLPSSGQLVGHGNAGGSQVSPTSSA